MNMRTGTKSDRLVKTRKWATTVTDGTGKPLDTGIVNTVVALQALGVHTTASCEGHLTHGVPGPWVDIASPRGEKLEDAIMQYIRKSKGRKRLPAKLGRLADEISSINLRYAKKLIPLLNEYYVNRKVLYDERIIISLWSYRVARLECQGAEFNVQATKATKIKALKRYQKEFRAFTKFLYSQIK